MSKRQKNYHSESFEMPIIPEKIYFTIGQTSELCDLKSHVLRYWETEFSMLAPVKRKGNRRYYTKKDIFLIMTIKALLYRDGFTIEGARLALKKKNKNTDKVSVQNHPDAKERNPVFSETVANLQTVLDLIEEDIT
jgi:DNA-binding transcriptional MerR regulator